MYAASQGADMEVSLVPDSNIRRSGARRRIIGKEKTCSVDAYRPAMPCGLKAVRPYSSAPIDGIWCQNNEERIFDTGKSRLPRTRKRVRCAWAESVILSMTTQHRCWPLFVMSGPQEV